MTPLALDPSVGIMITIQTRVSVNEHGVTTLRLPPGIAPGEHEVVLVIGEAPAARQTPIMAGFPTTTSRLTCPKASLSVAKICMTTAAVAPEPVFVDTNVLVYAAIPAFPLHTDARALLDLGRYPPADSRSLKGTDDGASVVDPAQIPVPANHTPDS